MKQFLLKRKPLGLAIVAALSATATIQVAYAGAGWGDSLDLNKGPIKRPTYYANSPSGMMPDADCFDALGAPIIPSTCNSGTALRKFVDGLPGLGASNASAGSQNAAMNGKYLPVAVADTATYAGSAYYEIAVVEYTEQLHSDLKKATRLRGYVQIDPLATDTKAGLANGAAAIAGSQAIPLVDADGNKVMISRPHNNDGTFLQVQAVAVDKPHYLGPVILASQGTPTRVKFYNALASTQTAGNAISEGYSGGSFVKRAGDLFIPTDRTLFGAGDGPVNLGSTRNLVDGNAILGPYAGPTPAEALTGPLIDATLPQVSVPVYAQYTQNRQELHLHGGDTPWISDGHPHQWITPAADEIYYNTLAAALPANGGNPDYKEYARGEIAYNVPDMPEAGPGAVTYMWPNGQSGRFMFYHDHASGLTRLNVYVGAAAGYLITDPQERLLNNLAPGGEIPLVLQDKTFVPDNIAQQDAKWDTFKWGQPGDLWFPHVYETNQDPNSGDGTNPVGRWDGASYFWPVFPQNYATPTGGFGQETTTPEAFMDTPVVNGTAYPTITVQPTTYRFRILAAGNDRMWNLGLYLAADKTSAMDGVTQAHLTDTSTATNGVVSYSSLCDGTVAVAPANCTEVSMVPFDASYALLKTHPTPTADGTTSFPDGSVPATAGVWGTGWGFPDARVGGVPDPATAGPSFVRIGTEGGITPQATVIHSTPVNYEYNKRSVTILNVQERGLWLGAAERADVLVDFSQYAGKTLILYNDSGAPVPAGDPRIDYYTGEGDQTNAGGAPNTAPGYGPNTRTVMQIVVAPGTPTAALDINAVNTQLTAAYAATQPVPAVPMPTYATDAAVRGYATASTPAHIYTGAIYLNKYQAMTFNTPVDMDYTPVPPKMNANGTPSVTPCNTTATCTAGLQYLRGPKYDGVGGQPLTHAVAGSQVNAYVESKAIQELFDPDYGRMNATLGTEMLFTNVNIQTTIPLAYVDPATERLKDGETQIWKITHNGVDTHPVHFHLVNIQVLNRVGWDGTLKDPAIDEIGWKETLKMHPLEDVIVAVTAKKPHTTFGLPHSVRRNAPNLALGDSHGFTQIDPYSGLGSAVSNAVTDYQNEYVWHCHILGHEENDFMRPVVFTVNEAQSPAPTAVAATVAGANVNVTWGDPTSLAAGLTPTLYANPSNVTGLINNPANEIGFRVESNLNGGAFTPVALGLHTINQNTPAINAIANATQYVDAGPFVTPTKPTAPVLAQTVTATSVKLTWPADANANGYTVVRTDPLGATATLTPSLSAGTWTLTDTTVAANTAYSYLVTATGKTNAYGYRVAAVNAKGDSAYSATSAVNMTAVNAPTTVSVTTPVLPLVAPTFPGNPVVNSTTLKQQTVTWNAVTGATGYLVQQCTGSTTQPTAATAPCGATGTGWTPINPVSISGTAATFSAPNAGTTYRYRVATVNAGGQSAYSTANVNLQTLAAPQAVSNLTLSNVSATGLTLNWQNNPGNASASMLTVSSVPGSTCTLNANKTACTASNLTGNTPYSFTVTPANPWGTGPASTINAILPGAVAGVSAAPGTAGTPITGGLNWTPVAGLTYQVRSAANAAMNSNLTGWTTAASGGQLTMPVTAVAGSTRYFQVRAVGTGGATGAASTATAVVVN
jgi:FtsP/CotA-like multicopper oxidase with cupredoxin domain